MTPLDTSGDDQPPNAIMRREPSTSERTTTPVDQRPALDIAAIREQERRMTLPDFDDRRDQVVPDHMMQSAQSATDFLKALAHEGRLMMLCHLATGEKSVTELEHLLGQRQAAVSQQLVRLRLDGLVSPRREGKAIYTTGSPTNGRSGCSNSSTTCSAVTPRTAAEGDRPSGQAPLTVRSCDETTARFSWPGDEPAMAVSTRQTGPDQRE